MGIQGRGRAVKMKSQALVATPPADILFSVPLSVLLLAEVRVVATRDRWHLFIEEERRYPDHHDLNESWSGL